MNWLLKFCGYDLIDYKLNLILEEVIKMSQGMDLISAKMAEITAVIDNVLVIVSNLKEQLSTGMTLEEAQVVANAIDEQKTKLTTISP